MSSLDTADIGTSGKRSPSSSTSLSPSLSLYFRSAPSPYLYRTEFSQQLLKEKRVAIRGKSGSFQSVQGSFTWSSAVRAFTLLVIKSLALHEDGKTYSLVGSKGTLAASLDDALYKCPQWIVDLFGKDGANRPVSKRLFVRKNGGRKSGPEVSVYVNVNFLPISKIQIFLDEKPISSASLLLRLATSIEEETTLESEDLAESGGSNYIFCQHPGSKESRNLGQSIPECFANDAIQRELLQGFYSEGLRALRFTENFDSLEMQRRVSYLRTETFYSKLIRDASPFEKLVRESRSHSTRLGSLGDEEKRVLQDIASPLQVKTSGNISLSLILLEAIRDQYSIPMEISSEYVTTKDIATNILENAYSPPPDICVLGLAAAVPLLNRLKKSDYKLLMFMPRVSNSHMINRASVGEDRQALNTDFYMTNSRPTSASIYYEALGRLSPKRQKQRIIHCEPDQIIGNFLRSESPLSTILWFPHSLINKIFTDSRYLYSGENQMSYQETLLFVHRKLADSPQLIRALEAAIRHVWLLLLLSPSLLKERYAMLLSTPSYLSFLARSTGLFLSKDNTLYKGSGVSAEAAKAIDG